VKEVRLNLPTILEAAARLGSEFEFLLPVAPTLDRRVLEQRVGGRGFTLVPEALPALHHARAGIVASGTATVEAAMMALPFVMVYRVSPLTYAVGRPRVKVAHFAMVNLIAGERVVPELVQDEFTAEKVVAAVREVLPDGFSRQRMLEGLARVRTKLLPPRTDGSLLPADRAAAAVLGLLPARSPAKI